VSECEDVRVVARIKHSFMGEIEEALVRVHDPRSGYSQFVTARQ
jgi:hypothetical protein